MRARWGLGPVFVLESLLNARRWQPYALRSLFVLLLLSGMVIVWIANVTRPFDHDAGAPSLQQMASVGEWFFYALTGIQISLVLLAAPAATAGSLGEDRARGALLHMMVTDLSDAEIVLGTLTARLAPVFAMIAFGVPVTAMAALLGGIDFGALVGAFVVTMAVALLGGALAMTLSVWVSRMHEVLMAVYVVEALWLLALPIWWSLPPFVSGPPRWFQEANPYVLAFAPYSNPGSVEALDFAAFVAGALVLSALLLGLSIARLRRVVVAGSGRVAKGARREWAAVLLKRVFPSWPSPTLDGNPLLWREWQRNRPSRLARRLWAGLLAVAWMQAAWGTYRSVNEGISLGSNSFENGLMVLLVFGFLMLSATAPTLLAEERSRGSLDVLMTAPVSTRAIVVAKWWGIYRGVLVLLPLPLYTSFFLAAIALDMTTFPWRSYPPAPYEPLTVWDRVLAVALCTADFLASGGVLASLGLALAVWIRRLGRAIATSVILFLIAGFGWIIFAELSFEYIAFIAPPPSRDWLHSNRWLQQCLASLSPIAGPINAVEAVFGWNSWVGRGWKWIGLSVVVLIKAAVAGLLLWLSIKTFDRCLGRISDARAPGPTIRGGLAANAFVYTNII